MHTISYAYGCPAEDDVDGTYDLIRADHGPTSTIYTTLRTGLTMEEARTMADENNHHIQMVAHLVEDHEPPDLKGHSNMEVPY